MTRREQLIALRDALQKATGPDVEIDLQIWWHFFTEHEPGLTPDIERLRLLSRGCGIPNFTASLDAAVTLVPEGYGWRAVDMTPWPCSAALIQRNSLVAEYQTSAATPALALCLARIMLEIEKANATAAP
jgi:hypothetical protein